MLKGLEDIFQLMVIDPELYEDGYVGSKARNSRSLRRVSSKNMAMTRYEERISGQC
jgi:hypothetical protein